MQGELALKGAILLELELALDVLAVLCCCVVLSLAFRALHGDDFNRSLLFATHIFLLKKSSKAPVRDRTADLSLTMAALYRLSYKGNYRNDSLLSLLEFLNCVKGI